MIGVGIALVMVGIVFLFIVPWVGIPVGIVGLALAILWVAGFGRRVMRGEQPQRRSVSDTERVCARSGPGAVKVPLSSHFRRSSVALTWHRDMALQATRARQDSAQSIRKAAFPA